MTIDYFAKMPASSALFKLKHKFYICKLGARQIIAEGLFTQIYVYAHNTIASKNAHTYNPYMLIYVYGEI